MKTLRGALTSRADIRTPKGYVRCSGHVHRNETLRSLFWGSGEAENRVFSHWILRKPQNGLLLSLCFGLVFVKYAVFVAGSMVRFWLGKWTTLAASLCVLRIVAVRTLCEVLP